MPRPTNEQMMEKKGWKTFGDEPITKKLSRNTKFNFEYVEIAARLKAAGLSDENIAFVLSVTPLTIHNWKEQYPQFKKACEEGKKIATGYVIAKGIKAACGYDYEDVNEKWIPHPGGTEVNGQPVYVLKERSVFKKHEAPNAQLLMFFLSNMDPENWKARHKLEIDENKNVNIRIDGKIVAEQIESLAGKFLEGTAKHVEAKEIKSETVKD